MRTAVFMPPGTGDTFILDGGVGNRVQVTGDITFKR